GCRAVGRRRTGVGRRRFPRPRLARARAHPLARLREPRTDLRRRGARPAGRAPAAAARTGRRVWRRRDRRVRPDHGGRSPELPALSPAGGRLPDRTLHAHRALRRRRQLSPAVAGAGRGSALVSSILEALRELEASKAPAAPPAWLERAEPPRARVAPGASPSEGMPAASRAPQAPAQPPGAASPAQDDSVVAVSAISYSPDVGRRRVTMRVGGTLVTLRE